MVVSLHKVRIDMLKSREHKPRKTSASQGRRISNWEGSPERAKEIALACS